MSVSQTLNTKLLFSALLVLLLAAAAPTAFARSSGWNIDRDDLDDDIVESFPAPVLFGVDVAVLVSDFSDPRDGGSRSHEGQDMRAAEGTPIVSPTEAIVIRVGDGASSGKYVYTANPGGETFRYMHLSQIADIKSGDELAVGDLIGFVGDTGNAPDGIYHLHFEVRDEDNDATDPYPRMTDEFTLAEKMKFLRNFWRDIDDEDEYAEFLVETYRDEFIAALQDDLNLPDEIEELLEDSGADEYAALMVKLDEVLMLIPTVLNDELAVGDTGTRVSLLQTYLLFKSEGPARDALAGATATGYYGSITAAAVSEYQALHDIDESGIYDGDTRQAMLKE